MALQMKPKAAPATTSASAKTAPRSGIARIAGDLEKARLTGSRDPMLKPRIQQRDPEQIEEANITQASPFRYACRIQSVEFIDDRETFVKVKVQVLEQLDDAREDEVSLPNDEVVCLHFYNSKYPDYFSNDMVSFVCGVMNCAQAGTEEFGNANDILDAATDERQIFVGRVVCIKVVHKKGKTPNKKTGEIHDFFSYYYDPMIEHEDGTLAFPEVDNRRG